MAEEQRKDPLHGVTLAMILEFLVEEIGWDQMGQIIQIRCFNLDPSIKSSLTFLRKTPWARTKVENLYLELMNVIRRENEEEGPAPPVA